MRHLVYCRHLVLVQVGHRICKTNLASHLICQRQCHWFSFGWYLAFAFPQLEVPESAYAGLTLTLRRWQLQCSQSTATFESRVANLLSTLRKPTSGPTDRPGLVQTHPEWLQTFCRIIPWIWHKFKLVKYSTWQYDDIWSCTQNEPRWTKCIWISEWTRAVECYCFCRLLWTMIAPLWKHGSGQFSRVAQGCSMSMLGWNTTECKSKKPPLVLEPHHCSTVQAQVELERP